MEGPVLRLRVVDDGRRDARGRRGARGADARRTSFSCRPSVFLRYLEYPVQTMPGVRSGLSWRAAGGSTRGSAAGLLGPGHERRPPGGLLTPDDRHVSRWWWSMTRACRVLSEAGLGA